MNLSWTAQQCSGNVFLSLGVKTLWKSKLWLIRPQSIESWSWSNCVWKNHEPHLAMFPQLLWSLLSSRIQLSSLQHSNPLKKNFTGAQHLSTHCVDEPPQTNTAISLTGFFPRWAVKNMNYCKQIPVIIYRYICPACNTCFALRCICSCSIHPLARLADTDKNTTKQVNR